ncbi:MAG: protein-L-isoaspartate O-methyltransferase, partial [Chlorobium sp.]|nr:protein-L-isoaspartate O-methyltransferase [Chlorobium sp.]
MEWTETQFDRQRREMVDSLQRNGIENPCVLEAFQKVRRHLFVPEEGWAHA